MKRLKDLGLDDKLQAALQAVRNRISAEFAVDQIVLFGSVARGQADEESDVDVLIVLKDPTGLAREIQRRRHTQRSAACQRAFSGH
jgi:uncharacterized protein